MAGGAQVCFLCTWKGHRSLCPQACRMTPWGPWAMHTLDKDPVEVWYHPGNCKSKRERRVLEFLLPILNPDKPKRISLTMANTLFGAMSGSMPVNWGSIIHELVAKALPNIGKKPSFLSPFILHLYQHYKLLLPEEEDMLTIASGSRRDGDLQ